MPARTPAWDRLLEEWSVLHGPLGDRTAPYDALLARRDALNPADDAYELSKVARDHARRVEYWMERLAGVDPVTTRPTPRHVERVLVGGGTALAIGLIALAWRTSWPLALAGALCLAGTVAALVHATRRSERPRLGEALARALCPDCAYDLSGLPPALPAHALGGRDIGPAACPECGGRWPRVPPPAPLPPAHDEPDPIPAMEDADG